MAENSLQAESANANLDAGSIAGKASNGFDDIWSRLDMAAALFDMMAAADRLEKRERSALVAVSALLEYRASEILETVSKYLSIQAEISGGGIQDIDSISVAWNAARDFETIGGKIEDISALADFLTSVESMEAATRNSIAAAADFLGFICRDASNNEATFDAIGEAVRAAGGKVVKLPVRPLH